MDEGKIGIRYAKALYLAGEEKKLLDTLYSDMIYITEVLREVPDFTFLMHNPLLKLTDKKKIFSAVFLPSVHALTMQFLEVIAANKRESSLGDIARCFIDLYRRQKNIRSARLTAAVPVPAETLQRISEVLSRKLNAGIEMEQQIDPRIIGGFVLRIDDIQWDASISSHLHRLKTGMQNTNQ